MEISAAQMKQAFCLLFLILCSCRSVNDFYQGRVVDAQNKPLKNVVVSELYRGSQTSTDTNGYFKLKRYSSSFLGDLVFEKYGYDTDTIPTVWHQAGETTEYGFVKDDTTIVRLRPIEVKEKLDLIVTQPKSGSRVIPTHWERLSDIQKDWIEIKEDSEGYLIYEPCDGYTRSISIKNGYLYVQYQMEPAYKFSMEKFTRIAGNQSFRLDAYDEATQTSFSVSAEIIDAKNGLVKWKFNDEVWLMTPAENADKFRKIKNNCPDYKRNELEFLEEK